MRHLSQINNGQFKADGFGGKGLIGYAHDDDDKIEGISLDQLIFLCSNSKIVDALSKITNSLESSDLAE